MTREECLAKLVEERSRGNYKNVARVLIDGYRGDLLTVDDLKRWVADTWLFLNPPTCPYGPLTVSDWVHLFRAIGCCMIGAPVDLGSEPYAIYRAAPVDRVKGMSWCTHLNMAKKFQSKCKLYGDYKLWRASVMKRSVLAVLYRPSDSWFGPGSETAREVVVDPAGLGELMPVHPQRRR